jgi:hypothetical protein
MLFLKEQGVLYTKLTFYLHFSFPSGYFIFFFRQNWKGNGAFLVNNAIIWTRVMHGITFLK